LLNSFNPTGVTTLCGIGYDPDSSHVWIYGCNAGNIQCFSTTGVLLNSFTAPGGAANDVDIEIAPELLTINNTTVPKGQLLFINGDVDAAEIYAVDNATGLVIDTLSSVFGTDHVVGGAYHPTRNTFFMIQDNVPDVALENLIAEINPLTGDTLQTFQITNFFSVSFGDIEVGTNGNLFVVSSVEDSIAEFTPQGTFVQQHALPMGVTELSGIALDCSLGQAWVTSTTGTVFHLGQFPCGTTDINEISQQPFYLSDVIPNPFSSEASFSISMKEPSNIKLLLMNMLGEEVEMIYQGKLDAGKRNFSLNEKSLTKGIYILHVESNTFMDAKRIVCIQ
jgi:hypothetical protein